MEEIDLRRSSRDRGSLRAGLEAWLATVLPEGSDPSVLPLEATETTGMSSETVLFEAEWTESDARRHVSLVARLAPDAHDVPVFPTYDLAGQYRTIRAVGESSEVPVPPVLWLEEDVRAIGTPFFVMEKVDGEVPPDVMPYTFGDNWLYDAGAEGRRTLQSATVNLLAQLHALERPAATFAFLAGAQHAGDPAAALQHHLTHTEDWYRFVASGGTGSPLLEKGLAWLHDHRPAHPGAAVLSWGDARIGNVLYRDFHPVAVLDWEMAGLGPRELDVGWLLYAHRVFDDIARTFDLPGMPGFLRPDDVATEYERATGYAARDLPFYMTYAAIQFGIVFLRTGQRSVHFGEKPMPDDVEELLYNRDALEQMLAGTYF